MRDIDETMARTRIENNQDWRGEVSRIPWIQFPADWQVQVIPPFADAVVRFRVKLPSGKEKSIYLDSRQSLGFYCDDAGNPATYWEVYPYRDDTGRCRRDDVAELLRMIGDESTETEQ